MLQQSLDISGVRSQIKPRGRVKLVKSSDLDNGERGKDEFVLGDISLARILPACLF